MQFITREITSYRCTFGKYDITANNMTDITTITLTNKPGQRKMAELSEQYGVCADVTEITKKYCMPIEVFVSIASEWMASHDERPAHMKNNEDN